jgi:cation diffusion facilitator CzcD-associated flavoprotein CzcO
VASTELISPAPSRLPAPESHRGGRDVSVLVIGAGFGGLAAAVALREAGLDDVTVVEQADRVGGVWRDNTYPGAACDVPSSLYSWSFAPNPEWPRRYAQQPDILRYIERTAAELDLLGTVRLGTEVLSARWDDASRTWHVTGRDRVGAEVTWDVDVLVPAVGQLSRPALPHIPGRDSFTGPAFHSARWDHGVDLRAKRVAVLGTGASAIQFVPEVQKVAAQVTVFQRSAPHVVPKPDRAYTRTHLRAFRRFPLTQGFGRELTRTLSERFNRALTEQTPFTKVIDAAFRLHLRHQVKDRALRRKLTPDYPIGCKRVLFSNDWYPALRQPHVEVVTDPIQRITPSGVRTVAGGATVDHEVDVVIHGTGFAATDFLAPMTVTGRDGIDLHEYWSAGAHGYFGITVPHFPNMFIVYGPNTNLGGSSIISMIECQTGYLAQAVQLLAREELTELEVRDEVAARYDQEVQDRLARSVWASGCVSWYQVEGGRVTTNWPGTVAEYRRRTETFEPSDYVAAAPDTHHRLLS